MKFKSKERKKERSTKKERKKTLKQESAKEEREIFIIKGKHLMIKIINVRLRNVDN